MHRSAIIYSSTTNCRCVTRGCIHPTPVARVEAGRSVHVQLIAKLAGGLLKRSIIGRGTMSPGLHRRTPAENTPDYRVRD